MAYYRITKLKALDSDRIKQIGEEMRDVIESMNADFIDIVENHENDMIVVARYPDESNMQAATATAQGVFGQMVAEGIADGSSIDQSVGKVTMSFPSTS